MGVINYTHDYSQFPNRFMDRHNFKDVNNDVASIINQVKELQAQGKYAEAANIVDSQDLKEYILSAEYINELDEETRNVEIKCISKKQSIYYFTDEPGFSDVGDVWIGGEK